MVAYVRSVSNLSTIVTSGVSALSSAFTPIGATNCVIGILNSTTSPGVLTMSDNAGTNNVYNVITSSVFGTYGTYQYLFYGVGLTGGPTDFTFFGPQLSGPLVANFDEFSAVSSVQSGLITFNPALSSPTFEPVTPPVANCMCWGYCDTDGTSNGIGPGFTLGFTQASNGGISEYQIQQLAVPLSVAFTQTSPIQGSMLAAAVLVTLFNDQIVLIGSHL